MIRPRALARRLTLMAAPIALVLGLVGCSGSSQPIAHVGPSALTRGDYMAAAAGATEQYPPTPAAAKAMLLEDLVRRRLLVLTARQRGLFDDTLTTNYRRLKEEELLIQALGQELSPTGNDVSEAELRQFYAWRDSAARVRVIYLMTRPAAAEAARLARAGEDFGAIADRFNPPGIIPPHGDIGPQQPGNLLTPLDQYVRTAAPNSIVGPLESPGQGWFVLHIGERVAVPQAPFEVVRRSLADILRQRKQRASIIRAVRRLQDSYALKVAPGAPQIVYAHLNLPEDAHPSYSPADLAQPLATWETAAGRQTYTFGDGLSDLSITGREKPTASLMPSIEQWILAEASRRLQIIEARRRGIDQAPDFQRRLDETVNNYLIEGLYSSEVMNEAQQQPMDAIEVYQRNPERYRKLDGITAQVIEFGDSAAAHAFTRHSGHGQDLRAAAAMVPGAPEVRDVTVRFPNSDPDWQRLTDVLNAMGEGDAMGPFRTSDGRFRIFLVVLKQTHVTPYDELDANDKAMLQQEGLEVARERRLMAWLDDLRREFPVKVDSAVVAKLPWPVPRPTS